MKHIQVPLQPGGQEYIELCHLLKVAGLADSSGQGKRMVADGLVRIDGRTETRKAAKIRTGVEVHCLDHCISVVAAE
ncbi:RNA-binding protein [Denitratisoma sp. DHT3]|uniref:RNA-binding S4 domain-containing protein n=1 Tax=Denitratisoma sp. DHT3 TaxID=1981880 RepID=UPI0011989DD2|nr:RNA-binding S4 domain-containing protein [Denitratisoma sp. DHT3]QDX81811.1 RNA-binding protein [Denitratisoma sp. DHT3]